MPPSLPVPLAVTYHWFFTDIVASSEPTRTADEQTLKIVTLNDLIKQTTVFKEEISDSTYVIPTGDGVAIGFRDSPEQPFLLSIQLHSLLYKYNNEKGRGKNDRISIRIGLNTGPVYRITDLNGNKNVWGPGIITARRVMDLARGMNILASREFARDILKLKREYRKYFRLIGQYPIKHNENIEIYNIFYKDEIGNPKAPPNPNEQANKFSVVNPIVFSSIDLSLDIMNPKTMLAHHVLTWRFVNMSEHEIDRLFYAIDGDIQREFRDLHVKVIDGAGRRLGIMSVDVNKPHHKEFFVLLQKPIQPRKKGIVKLEYDWEEKDKRFGYRFASDCKKFNYFFRAPKSLSINQRVVQVNIGTGEKVRAKTPPEVRYLPRKTEVRWSVTNARSNDEYRFDW